MNREDRNLNLLRPRHRFLPLITRPVWLAGQKEPSRTGARPLTASLVFTDAARCSEILTKELHRLGKRTFSVRHPLEAIDLLENKNQRIDAAFMSLQDVSNDVVEFFLFLQDEFLGTRRIAFAQHEAIYSNPPALQACAHEMILWDPWARPNFDELLEGALNAQPRLSQTNWSDSRLCRSQHGANRTAIATLLGRYLYRIQRLVIDETPDSSDADDVIQNACLAIVELLPAFDNSCSPGEWIDRVARSSIRSFRDAGNARADVDPPTSRR